MEIGEMPKPITTWIPLTDSRKCNAKWGELMFSLSYLPTAERLTIVVVKARNLQLQVPSKEDPNIVQDVQNVFVKVSNIFEIIELESLIHSFVITVNLFFLGLFNE